MGSNILLKILVFKKNLKDTPLSRCSAMSDYTIILEIHILTLDYQSQVDSKPASQPEQASLNQCHLIAQNRCSPQAQLKEEIRFLCNVINTRDLVGSCSHVALR